MHHNKNYEVASTGVHHAKEVSEDDDEATTRWTFDHPVALVTFAVGLFDFYEESGLIEDVPISFYSIRGQRIDEEFMAAEMGNDINSHQLFHLDLRPLSLWSPHRG